MNSEREIVQKLKKLRENAAILPVEDEEEDTIIRGEHHPISTADTPDIPLSEKAINEAGFEANGNIYKCAFGHYTCNGEPITREDYFKAKEGNGGVPSSNSSSSGETSIEQKYYAQQAERKARIASREARKNKSYEDYTETDFKHELGDLEEEFGDLISDISQVDDITRREEGLGEYETQMEDLRKRVGDLEGHLPDSMVDRWESLYDDTFQDVYDI